MAYHVDIVEGESSLAAWWDDWCDLTRRAIGFQPFYQPTWVEVWRRTMDVGREPVLLGVRDDAGRLVALLPMVEVVGLGGSGLWPMSFHTSDNVTALYAEDAPEVFLKLAEGLEQLFESHVFVWLPLIEKTFWQTLKDALGHSRIFNAARVRTVDVSLRVDLQTAQIEPTGKSAKKRRYEQRQLEAFGEVRYESLTDAASVEGFVPRLRWLERQSWKAQADTGLFRLQGSREMYSELLPKLAAEGKACIDVLYAGEEVLACQVGLLGEGVYGLHNTSYHPGFSEYSPGTHLLTYSMCRARDHGVRVYDFMQGEQIYKKRLATSEETLMEVSLFAPRLSGMVCRVLTGIRLKGLKQPS